MNKYESSPESEEIDRKVSKLRVSIETSELICGLAEDNLRTSGLFEGVEKLQDDLEKIHGKHPHQ